MNSTHNLIHKLARIFALWLVVVIIASAVGAVYVFTGGVSLFKKVTDGEEITSTQTYDNVEKLDIELSNAALEIIQGSDFSVSSNDSRIKVKNSSGRLKVTESSVASFDGRKVTITIPNGVVFEEIAVESGAGIVEADTLQCKKFNLEVGAGEVSVNKLVVSSSADIEVGVGKLNVKNSEINNFSLEVGVGEGVITGIITGKSEIDAGIGEVNLTVTLPKDNYTVKAETGIGSMVIDGEKIKGDCVLGNGSNILEISGGIGSVSVKFQ